MIIDNNRTVIPTVDIHVLKPKIVNRRRAASRIHDTVGFVRAAISKKHLETAIELFLNMANR